MAEQLAPDHGTVGSRFALLIAGALLFGCASSGTSRRADHYLRYVAFEVPVNEHVTLRWQKRRMPLKVHLPRPPEGFVSDPEAVWDSVRDGITDWADVAADGVPSFRFVDDAGEADIPIVWERKSSGGDAWYIAFAGYDIQPFARRFGVSHIVITARREDGSEASLGILYQTVLHEMGHALGLGGHSPDRADIMYPKISGSRAEGLSPRDRETLRLLYHRPNGHRVTGARRGD